MTEIERGKVTGRKGGEDGGKGGVEYGEVRYMTSRTETMSKNKGVREEVKNRMGK